MQAINTTRELLAVARKAIFIRDKQGLRACCGGLCRIWAPLNSGAIGPPLIVGLELPRTDEQYSLKTFVILQMLSPIREFFANTNVLNYMFRSLL